MAAPGGLTELSVSKSVESDITTENTYTGLVFGFLNVYAP